MDHDTIRALIQKYRSQIEGLQSAIRLLESELGPTGSVAPPSDVQSANGSGAMQPRKEGEIPVRQWEFFNKSQTDAAEELLQRVGHPLSISDLLDTLERGGLKVGGESALVRRQNLGTQLGRSGRFGKAARGTWGLPAWPNIKPVKLKRGDERDKDDDENDTEVEKAKAVSADSRK